MNSADYGLIFCVVVLCGVWIACVYSLGRLEACVFICAALGREEGEAMPDRVLSDTICQRLHR